ncbi:MAG: NAD(P)H-hydrate epimerase, partial [Roseiarcus sp.]|uniref:NAD(P)H-hydrate epimerase n=1 Tax=Roseiarcus sp. TaxID=1969460 RepID=UPI003C337F3D
MRRAKGASTLAAMLDPKARPELLTPAEMSEADRFAVAAGTPGIALMERAGLAVADEAARLAKSRGRIVVLCGPGGNGGDGFIAGRLLAKRGYAVELGLIGRREALRGDPALAASRYEGQVLDAEAIDPGGADCVIDAVFGAGLARDIDGPAKMIIERVNAFAGAGGRVVAVDVPSGVDGGTGKVRGVAVEASASVTFFRLKPGHLLLPGRMLCGAIRLADIGIPEAALARIAPQAFVNAPAVWREGLPHVGAESHKYARGAVLVLSGA